MAAPTIVSCTADSWVKVATNVTSATIHIRSYDPTEYYQTYVLTGVAAPSGVPSDANKAQKVVTDQLWVQASAAVDVYLYAKDNAGSVRVDA